MIKKITQYITSCNDDELYSLWDKLINEMNRRKTNEVKQLQKNQIQK